MHEAVAIFFTFTLAGGLISVYLYLRQRRQHHLLEAQRDLQTRILERFDSPSEFSAFLQTRGGQRFLSGLTDARGWRPARRIMLAVQIGLVITFFGFGLVVVSGITGSSDALYPSVIVFCVGLGFLAAAGASYWMSRSWRLLPGQDELDLESTLHQFAGRDSRPAHPVGEPPQLQATDAEPPSYVPAEGDSSGPEA